MKHSAILILPLATAFPFLTSCEKKETAAEASPTPAATAEASPGASPQESAATPVPDAAELQTLKSRVVNNYADIVFTSYSDSLKTAQLMQTAIRELVETPSAETLEKAKDAWKAARVPYLQTEVYRFYGGPIDDEESGVEGLLNAWPMDENYIDYVQGDASTGIIADQAQYPEITQTLLVDLNEKAGEANISTGYHAIEFLLWGQDFSEDGPGNRPHTDYVASDSGPGAHAERRGKYLLAITDLLVENLQELVDAWNPDVKGNYREAFLQAPTDESLTKILQGMGMLAGFELSGERLTVAYETQSQEDEHSCFSDNTHVDMLEDARGIRNIWRGQYKALDGTSVGGAGVQALAEKVDPQLEKKVSQQLNEAVELAGQIPVPFDQAIKGDDSAAGRMTIRQLIDSLVQAATGIATLAEELGLQISIEGEEEEAPAEA